MTVIDTSIFVDAQRGRHEAREKLHALLRSPEDVAVSAMTVLEVYSAPRISAAWERFYAAVFSSIEILELDAPSARHGAALARDMARRGLRLQNADAAIAGSAARAGAALLVTSDAVFTDVRGLHVEYLRPS